MSTWSYDKPPTFHNPKHGEPVATTRGWEDPDTGEVLATIGKLSTKAGAADVVAVVFDDYTLDLGQAISVSVRYNERVDVTAGAKITLNWTGEEDGTIDLYALGQPDQNIIVFNKASNLTDSVVPSIAIDAELSISSQTISGTIKDAGSMTVSNKTISSGVAILAGIAVIDVPAVITEVNFDDIDLARGDAISVAVTFSEAVDITAGAKILLNWSGMSGNFYAYALAQTNEHIVKFTKLINLTGNVVVPNQAGTLTIAAQTLVGTIKDHGTTLASNKIISSDVATAFEPVIVS